MLEHHFPPFFVKFHLPPQTLAVAQVHWFDVQVQVIIIYCDGCRDGLTQEQWQVNSLVKIIVKICLATQRHSACLSLFLGVSSQKMPCHIIQCVFHHPGVLYKKYAGCLSHFTGRSWQPCFQLGRRALSALVRRRHIWWKDPTAMPRRQRLRGPPCLALRAWCRSSIGTESNDSKARFLLHQHG